MVIFCNSLLYTILSLVFLIISSCCVLFLLDIEFLSFIFLLVYIGAIAVLFLFIIMMLQLNKLELEKKVINVFSSSNLLYFIIVLKFIYFFFFLNKRLSMLINFFSYEFMKSNEIISIVLIQDSIFFLNLFTQNFFFFILVAIILLFSMVGSIALCVKQKLF